MTRNYLDILAETIRSNWDQPALTDFYLTEDGTAQDTSRGNHYTYGEMYTEVCRVADLLTSLDLQKGDHIAICGANSAHWCIAYLAIAKMQGVSVTVMQTLKPEEIARQIDFSDAKALVTDPDLWTKLAPLHQPCMGDLSSVISLADWQILRGEKISNYQLQITNGEIGFSPVEPDSLAMICFTSGSTSASKAVMLPYRSLTNNMYNTWEVYPMCANPNTILMLPLAHTFGLTSDFIGQITVAKHLHILKSIPSPSIIYSSILNIRPYALTIIPVLLISLYDSYKEKLIEEIKKSCHFVASGGVKFSPELEATCQKAGVILSVGYGLTETGPAISGSSHKLIRPKSCGKIFKGMTARISTAGEILVKGENVMLGYYKDPEATAAKIDSDGWLHTGDKGYLDEDGYLYVEGRLEQDIIVLPNGENIRPDNIESLINALPEVSESIVLARDGKLVAIAVPQITNQQSQITNTDLRRIILRKVNPSLPLYSQLYDVEITDIPLQKTEKQTIKRYLYK